MLSEQLTAEQKADQQELARLSDTQKGALRRLLANVERDGFRRFAEGDERKSWIKGFREAVGDVMAAFEQTLEDAQSVREELKADREIAGEASGSDGDLAIG